MKQILAGICALVFVVLTGCTYKATANFDPSTGITIQGAGQSSSVSNTCRTNEEYDYCEVGFTVTPPTGKYVTFDTTCYDTFLGEDAESLLTEDITDSTLNLTNQGDWWAQTNWIVGLTGNCSVNFSLATNVSSCTTFPCIYEIPKVTGHLKGIKGADMLCKDLGPASASTYKALLVDNIFFERTACTSANCQSGGVAEHTDWPLAANTTYYRPDGTIIATTDSNGLLPATLTNSVFGQDSFWAGFGANYLPNSNVNCAGWRLSFNDGSLTATMADGSVTTNYLGSAGDAQCLSRKSLACVAAQTIPTKIMFETAASHNGNLGGVSGADSICNSDSNKPSGSTSV